jgi:hypothetical protein
MSLNPCDFLCWTCGWDIDTDGLPRKQIFIQPLRNANPPVISYTELDGFMMMFLESSMMSDA